jgi:5'-nucleotidase
VSRNILVTNDDGYRSIGIRSLVKSIKDLGNLTIVAPDGPRSAAGLSVTLYRPLRMREVIVDGTKFYAVNGTPGDCITIGLFYLCGEAPDIVVSGINIGENLSLLEFFMSGTVAGAILASIYNVPAIAFSKRETYADVTFTYEVREGYDTVSMIAAEILRYFLDEGFPDGVSIFNVNFPENVDVNSRIVITKLASRSLYPKIIIRDDPRGRPYYWIWGEKLRRFPDGTDAHEVIEEGNISVTPIMLDGLNRDAHLIKGIDRFKKYMDDFLVSFWKK